MHLDEVHRADPRARRRALWTVIIGAVCGVALLLVAEHYQRGIEEWVAADSHARLGWTFALLAAMIVLPIGGLSMYLWRVGTKIIAAERFPPQDATVIRDTIVQRGSKARRRGRLIRTCAATLAALGFGICLLLWCLLLLLEPPGMAAGGLT